MRLVLWNCNMAMHRKLDVLLALKPDVAILPECASPDVKAVQGVYAAASSHAWVGDLPSKGLAVLSFGASRLTALPPAATGRFNIPLLVDGPVPFRLLAIWTQLPGYVREAHLAVDGLEEFLGGGGPLVVAGDLNSNQIWDGTHAPNNHSRLVERLAALDMCSAYHAHSGEAQGSESRPTFFWYRHADKPFHLDHVFVPNAWRAGLHVEVGAPEAWLPWSDHVPMTVVIDVAS